MEKIDDCSERKKVKSLFLNYSWERVIQLEPTYVDAYSGLATGHFTHKNYEKCKEVLLAGLERSPRNVHLLYNLGNLYFREKRNTQAAHYLRLVLDISPSYRNTENLLKTLSKRLEQEAQN